MTEPISWIHFEQMAGYSVNIPGTQFGPNENGCHWPSRHELKHATT